MEGRCGAAETDISTLFELPQIVKLAPTVFDRRQELTALVMAYLKDRVQAERKELSHHSPVAKAVDYMLRHCDLFARFLDDGRICLTNNAADRALRGIAWGRKSWLFCGSNRGGVRAVAMYTLIGTARLNDVHPQAWRAPVAAVGSTVLVAAATVTIATGKLRSHP